MEIFAILFPKISNGEIYQNFLLNFDGYNERVESVVAFDRISSNYVDFVKNKNSVPRFSTRCEALNFYLFKSEMTAEF